MAKYARIKIYPHGSNPRKRRKPIATISVRGRSKKHARNRASSLISRILKNVEKGFYDSTGFHPIRASRDYSGAKAGETRARSKTAVRTRARAHAHRARKARRGAIS